MLVKYQTFVWNVMLSTIDLSFSSIFEASFLHEQQAGGASQFSSEEEVQRVDPLRVVLKPPREFSWLFIAMCPVQTRSQFSVTSVSLQ